MIMIHDRLKETGSKTKMILQIHDELLFESPEDELTKSMEIIKYEMENSIQLKIPLKVDIGYGENWADAH